MNESVTEMRAHSTAMYAGQKWLVPSFVSSRRGLAACYPSAERHRRGFYTCVLLLFFSTSSPASSLCADTNCRLRWKLHGGDPEASRQLTDLFFFFFLPHQSISALNLDVGRNTSESSRACSCWPACLLLWKRPRRPILEGWSGSAGRATWSPGWGRSRAGCRLA